MKISVIVPTFDRPEALSRCLNFLLSQGAQSDCLWEVVVSVDSRDSLSSGFLSCHPEYTDKVRFVKASKPGLNAARNKGIVEAKGAIIVFLDDDCLVSGSQWLDQVEAGFARYPDASVIGGGYFSQKDAPIFVRNINFLYNRHVENSLISECQTRALLGGNSAYRRFVFDQVGFFDEVLKYGSDETEMNDRIFFRGGKLYFLPELSVVHAMFPRSPYRHFAQSFLQGKGKAYSWRRNIKHGLWGYGIKINCGCLREAMSKARSVSERGISFLFIFFNAIFYRIGFYWGLMLCKTV